MSFNRVYFFQKITYITSKRSVFFRRDDSFDKGNDSFGGTAKKDEGYSFEPNIDSWMNRANRLSSCIKEV